MAWGFDHMQRPDGGSVYLRLSTRAVEQPRRDMSDALAAAVTAGGILAARAGARAAISRSIAMGAVVPEAIEAVARIGERNPRGPGFWS